MSILNVHFKYEDESEIDRNVHNVFLYQGQENEGDKTSYR